MIELLPLYFKHMQRDEADEVGAIELDVLVEDKGPRHVKKHTVNLELLAKEMNANDDEFAFMDEDDDDGKDDDAIADADSDTDCLRGRRAA